MYARSACICTEAQIPHMGEQQTGARGRERERERQRERREGDKEGEWEKDRREGGRERDKRDGQERLCLSSASARTGLCRTGYSDVTAGVSKGSAMVSETAIPLCQYSLPGLLTVYSH